MTEDPDRLVGPQRPEDIHTARDMTVLVALAAADATAFAVAGSYGGRADAGPPSTRRYGPMSLSPVEKRTQPAKQAKSWRALALGSLVTFG